jgi:hypothetical protein
MPPPFVFCTLLATNESTRWEECFWQEGQSAGWSACATGRRLSKVFWQVVQKYS